MVRRVKMIFDMVLHESDAPNDALEMIARSAGNTLRKTISECDIFEYVKKFESKVLLEE